MKPLLLITELAVAALLATVAYQIATAPSPSGCAPSEPDVKKYMERLK